MQINFVMKKKNVITKLLCIGKTLIKYTTYSTLKNRIGKRMHKKTKRNRKKTQILQTEKTVKTENKETRSIFSAFSLN